MFQNIKRLAGLPSFLPFIMGCIDTAHRLVAEAEAADRDDERALDATTSGFAVQRDGGVSSALLDVLRLFFMAQADAQEDPSADVCVPCVEAFSVYREIFRDPARETLDEVRLGARFLGLVVDEAECAVVAAGEAGQHLLVRSVPGGISLSLDAVRWCPIVLGTGGQVRIGGDLVPPTMTARRVLLLALDVLSTPRTGGGGGAKVLPIDRGPKGPTGATVPAQNAPTSTLPN